MILVIRPAAIGDLVLTLPAIASLRRRFPRAYIEIMGSLSTLELARNRRYADDISSFERAEIASLFSGGASLPRSIVDYFKRFDLVISYLRDSEQIFTENIRKTGVRRVISFDPLPIITGNNLEPTRMHIIDHLLRPVISIGIKENEAVREPRIYLDEVDRAFATRFFVDNNLRQCVKERVVAIHPGSGSKKKNWPVQRFVEVARYMARNVHVKLLVIYGPAEDEIADDSTFNFALSSFQEISVSHVRIVKNISLPFLAAILERVDCFIGNDGGVSHIAAAVGAPTFTIFGPTDPGIWAPRGENVKVIKGDCSCSPCTRMRDCKDQRCLKAVGVDDVINAARQVKRGACQVFYGGL